MGIRQGCFERSGTMKKILDLPDTTRCAFLNCVFQGSDGLMIGSRLIGSDDLKDGAEIKIEPKQD